MPEPSRLQHALADACEFARIHGADGRIEPSDFAVQRRAPGTHAVYVDADMAIVVVIDEHGRPTFGLADLSWVHFPDVEHGTQACTDECNGRRLDLAAVADSDIAMDIYLSGWASGMKSAFMQGANVPGEEANQLAQAAVDLLQGDPIAIEQLRQVIRDIVHNTNDAPTHVTAYGKDDDA